MQFLFLFFTMASAAAAPISMERFQSMLLTEVTHEFTTHSRHLVQDDMWDAALEHEFKVFAERQAAENTPSPFLVCDFTAGKTGDLCFNDMSTQLGTQYLLPVINKVDQTCFIATVLPSIIAGISSSLAAIPVTAEMKMEQNLIDRIEQQQIQRIDATFCLGQVHSNQQAQAIAIRVLLERSHRHLSTFLESRVHRSEEREVFWRHRLEEDMDMERCQDMYTQLELDVTTSSMSLVFTQEQTLHTECLHALVIHLATQPEICFIGGYQPLQLLNDIASGIVQDGENYKNTLFHNLGLNGTGQVVAMSDTGVDVDNCYFYDANTSVPKAKSVSFDLSARKIVQYYTYEDDVDDPSGHGTHVACTIVGFRDDGKTGRANGIAKGAKLAVFDMKGPQGMRRPAVSELFDPGYAAGARIHSASWGVDNENRYTGFDRDIDGYVYDHPDLLFVVAAGNSGIGNKPNTVSSPAIAKNGITVGATENKPDGLVADFSSLGPTADGRMKPDVVAPGVRITSARSDPSSQGECDESNGLLQMSGTSMATPLVAGVAALTRQYFIEGWYLDGTKLEIVGYHPRASLVKAVILNGAENLRSITGSYPSEPYDTHEGFGHVNLKSSLPINGENDIKAIFVNAQSISSGDEITYDVEIDYSSACTGPLSATLVWTDPPAAPFCNLGCVLNDLDLFMTRRGTDGTIFPNNLNQADSTNNAERIRIENPLAGDIYTIHVKGTELLKPQEYSLVVTGCLKDETVINEVVVGVEVTEKQDKDCVDGQDLIYINDYETKDCEWLSQNIETHGFLCSYTDVVSECPSTCKMCTFKNIETGQQSLAAHFDSGDPFRWYGTTFDMAIVSTMTFQGLNLYLSSKESYRVQVFVSPGDRGSVDSNPHATWTSVCNALVKGAGTEQAIRIEGTEYCRPYNMNENSYYTVQVRVEGVSPDLILSKHKKGVGLFVLVNEHMMVRSGVALPFANDNGHIDGYILNGSVLYTLSDSQTCVDNPGSVDIEDVGKKDCGWLTINRRRFGYACDTTVVASHCPKTCGVCSDES